MHTDPLSWRPFRRLSGHLRERYGERVFKVSLHCGFSCPNRDGTVGTSGCTFCSGPALHPVGHVPGTSVEEQLATGMEYVRRRHRARRFIAHYQDYSATHAPGERLARLYRPALEEPDVVGLAVSTRPDCLADDALAVLHRTALRKDLWVELGLQVADDQLLEGLNRCHTVADFVVAAEALRALALPVCVHVIIGLPGATVEHEQRTAELLADLGVWGVKLHAFHVLRDTAMERRRAAGEIEALALGEHVRRTVAFIERLPPETVIHRVTAESHRHLTLSPEWTLNKLAVYNRVVRGFEERGTWQGRLFSRSNP